MMTDCLLALRRARRAGPDGHLQHAGRRADVAATSSPTRSRSGSSSAATSARRRCPPRSASMVKAGEIELEMVPQGTLIERVRAGGAGLAGVLHADRRRAPPIAARQGGARLRRQALHLRARPHAPTSRSCRRYQADAGRQPHLPARHAQLRPGVRHGGEDDDRRGARRSCRSAPRSRGGGHARHLRRPHRADDDAPRPRRAAPDPADRSGAPPTWKAARSRTAAASACPPT